MVVNTPQIVLHLKCAEFLSCHDYWRDSKQGKHYHHLAPSWLLCTLPEILKGGLKSTEKLTLFLKEHKLYKMHLTLSPKWITMTNDTTVANKPQFQLSQSVCFVSVCVCVFYSRNIYLFICLFIYLCNHFYHMLCNTKQSGAPIKCVLTKLVITHPAQERLTTLLGSTFPTLCKQWWGPTGFCPYPRRLESLTVADVITKAALSP